MTSNDRLIDNGWSVQKKCKESRSQRTDMDFAFLHVCKTHPAYTPFYSESAGGSAIENKIELPRIDKDFVRRNFDLFLDHAGLRKIDLEKHLESFSLDRTLKNHLVFHSSGSSGRKSYSIYSKEAFGKSLFELYDKTLLPYVVNDMTYIGLIDRYNGGNQWMYFLSSVMNVSFVDILSPLTDIARELVASKPEAIFTKPSILLRLIDETGLDKGSLPRLKHIVSVGENISEYQRQCIVQKFGVVPLNSFSTTETGPIGFQKESYENGLSLYNMLNRVEILDGNDSPIIEANVPGRLVVTNLYNTSFPLFRYELKDVAAWRPDRVGEEITPVLGRCDKELVFYDGASVINEWVLWSIEVDMASALQFQKLSNDVLRVCVVKKNNSTTKSYFSSYVRECLVQHGIDPLPVIKVEFVEKIGMDVNTSKVKKVI